MKKILLSSALMFLGTLSVFAQSNSEDKESVKLEQELSEEDSILVNCYFTEKEYNRIHGIYQSTTASNSEYTYEDEIYKGEKNKKRGRDTFLSDIPVELVVDVVLHTLFFVAILWQ